MMRMMRETSCLAFQRYDGDVGDLGLTLSYDEDVMGQVSLKATCKIGGKLFKTRHFLCNSKILSLPAGLS